MKLISRSHWAPDAPSTFPCFVNPKGFEASSSLPSPWMVFPLCDYRAVLATIGRGASPAAPILLVQT